MRKKPFCEVREEIPLEYTKHSHPKSIICSNGKVTPIKNVSSYFRNFYPSLNERTIDIVYEKNYGHYNDTLEELEYVSKHFPDILINESDTNSKNGEFGKKSEISTANSMKFNFDINKLGITIDVNSLAKNNTNE